jgi:UbiD family decarboxylase
MSDRAAFHRQSMRAWMASLEQQGQMQMISAPVSLDYDIAACLAEADRGPALRFDNVVGHSMPVVGNLLNSLPRFAAAAVRPPIVDHLSDQQTFAAPDCLFAPMSGARCARAAPDQGIADPKILRT